MGLGRLASLKKDDSKDIQTIYKKHLVFGRDLYSVDLYLHLVEKYGEENVAIFSREEISRESLKFEGPSPLRTKACQHYLQKVYPDVTLSETDKTSLFFKEGSFREFGGRSKPEKLLWGEETYIEPRIDFNVEEFFPFLKEENALSLNERLEKGQLNYIPGEIQKKDPTDLVEPVNFEIICTAGVNIACENLYMGTSPQQFLSLYKKKEELSDNFMELCEQTKTPASLFITFEFEKAIAENPETLFLPLSYTHEWGHFMGEFAPTDANGKQVARFLNFLDTDHTNEEGISKKIRLLKRLLEKIFPEFKNISFTESIILTESSMCLNFDDSEFQKILKEFKNLSFVGASAPLESFAQQEDNFEYSSEDLFFLARGVASLVQVKNQLH